MEKNLSGENGKNVKILKVVEIMKSASCEYGKILKVVKNPGGGNVIILKWWKCMNLNEVQMLKVVRNLGGKNVESSEKSWQRKY